VWQANRTRVEVDLSEALFQGDFSKDVTVRPGDVVVVPATEQSALLFTVVGDVNRPGYYTLREGQPTTVADAIGLAGGVRTPGAPVTLLRNVDNRPTSVVRPLPELLAEPLQVGDLLIVGDQAQGRAQ
jgi:protein involved in polysaccharide export with SLBB domain